MNVTVPTAGLVTPLHRPDWSTRRLKFLFERRTRPVMVDDGIVTAFRDGVVTLRSNRREDGFTMADKEIGYQGVEPRDLVIHAMDGFAGAIGVSDSRGKCSPVYTIAVPRKGRLQSHTHFWAYYLRNLATSGFIQSLAKGIRERSTDFRWNDASNLLVNFPDFETQKAIADFLDRETVRIDQLIEKKERIIERFGQKIESLVHEGIIASSTENVRFGFTASRVYRPVDLKSGATFVRLGLYNRGRGVFKKPEADEEGMGDSSFFWVEPGDLILSGQFAWEGAVALASGGEAGCVVSHRYPVYSGTKRATTAYLLAFLRTKMGDLILNEASRGSAGRNRPLNVNRLEKEKIPIPNAALQARIGEVVSFEMEIRRKIQTSIDLLQEHRSALITAAVTGQIDVATWGKRGTTDRLLDAIEAEMAAAAQLERQQVRA